MLDRIPRCDRLVAVAFVLVANSVSAGRAAAHAAPALPPVFDPGPCIAVIDRDETPTAQFAYRVEMDDTMLTTGDIDLPDAMTHQFFAFHGAIVFEGFAPEVWSVEPGGPNLVPMPLWITRGDVERAQKQSDTAALGYDLSEVTADATLETMSGLSNRWRRITPDDARRPITLDQALLGVSWNLNDVTPGVYTIAGYIFSPPYNGWEVRRGLVKVKDAEHDPLAAVVERVQESLFRGQGRRVRACLDVPEGTSLRTFAQVEDLPGAEWSEWGREEMVATGEVERCFVPADPALTGSLRLRFDLVAPAGETRSFYSPDTLLVLGGEAPCQGSDTLCCPAATSGEPDAGFLDAGPAEAAETAVDAASEPAARGRDAGGCGITPAAGATALPALCLLLVFGTIRRARRRSHQDRHAE